MLKTWNSNLPVTSNNNQRCWGHLPCISQLLFWDTIHDFSISFFEVITVCYYDVGQLLFLVKAVVVGILVTQGYWGWNFFFSIMQHFLTPKARLPVVTTLEVVSLWKDNFEDLVEYCNRFQQKFAKKNLSRVSQLACNWSSISTLWIPYESSWEAKTSIAIAPTH